MADSRHYWAADLAAFGPNGRELFSRGFFATFVAKSVPAPTANIYE